MLLVIGLGLLEFLGIERLAAHLKQDGADAVDCGKIIGVLVQDFLEFRDGLVAARQVFLRRRARDIQAGVGRGQVQAGIEKLRIGFLGLFEVFNGCVRLAIFEGGDTFVEEISSLQFAAAGGCKCENQERG